MISVCFLFFKISLPRGGSYPSTVIPTGAKHRVQSPLERWPRTISTDRPEMESRPYEFLLQNLTFSSPVAIAEFSKFAGILSAAVSQHHLLGFEIAQLEFHHLH